MPPDADIILKLRGVKTYFPLKAGILGGTAAYGATCDMTGDGGGWTLFGYLTGVPAGGGGTYNATGYDALAAAGYGVTQSGSHIAGIPSGDAARIEISGSSGAGAFRMNFKSSSASGPFSLSTSASYSSFTADTFIPGESTNVVTGGSPGLAFSASRKGYPYASNGADAIIQIDMYTLNGPSITIGGTAYPSNSGTTCGSWTSNALYWTVFQTGSGGYACKNTMQMSNVSGCNTVCTPAVTASTLKLYYR